MDRYSSDERTLWRSNRGDEIVPRQFMGHFQKSGQGKNHSDPVYAGISLYGQRSLPEFRIWN
ncbi:hypothetical protein D3C71_2204080 [compost metagenome]